MAWATIRRATEEDTARLERAARRFAERHGIIESSGDAVFDVEFAVEHAARHGIAATGYYPDDGRLLRRWRRYVQWALGGPAEGVAYGYVGYEVGD